MSLTNFSKGIQTPVLVSPGLSNTTGKVFYVCNAATRPVDVKLGSNNGNDGSYNQPYATLAYAISRCVVGRGDLIRIMPGHAETLATAGAIAASVSGITIEGIGQGALKPTFTFSNTAATFTVAGNNVKIKNIIGTPSVDSVVNAFVVTGDNCDIDIEWRDASAAVEAITAVRLDTADNSKLNLVYKGFTAGNAVVRAVAVDDCDNVDITIYGYGIVSTAWVNLVDAASTNVNVSGVLYTQAITNFTRDVVDTVGGSTWFADLYDASFGGKVSGGSAAALASDDVSAVGTAIAAIQTDIGDPSARTNLKSLEAMLGNPDVAGATIYAAVGGAAGLPTYPAGAQAANDVSVAEVVRYAQEALRLGTGGTALANNKSIYDALGTDGAAVTDVATSILGAIGADNANNAFESTNVVANADGSVLERLEEIDSVKLSGSRRSKNVTLAAADLTGTATRFTIANGPIKVWSLGILVTTAIPAGANTCKFSFTPTGGGATDLCAATDTASAGAQQLFVVDGTKATALVKTTDVGILAAGQIEHMPMILSSGVVQTIFSAGAPATGAAVAYIEWEPLNSTATVS